MVKYDRLWETMKQKDVSQYRLIKYYGFSAGQLSRLKKNMYVSTHTIEVLCNILGCSVQDVMEVFPDALQELEEKSTENGNENPREVEESTNLKKE